MSKQVESQHMGKFVKGAPNRESVSLDLFWNRLRSGIVPFPPRSLGPSSGDRLHVLGPLNRRRGIRSRVPIFQSCLLRRVPFVFAGHTRGAVVLAAPAP